MDLRQRILESNFSISSGLLGGGDPLAKERKKVLEPLRREIHNEAPPIIRYSYSETICDNHENFFVSKILKALKKSGLQHYKLHCGEAYHVHFSGRNLCLKEEISEEVFELRNQKEGFSLQFRIVEEFAFPAIHALFLIRDTKKQGSFFAIKRMLIDDLWLKVLVAAGFGLLFGRAVYSNNSEIRHSCTRSKDWREILCYAGLDENLEPILIPGLRLFYYRLGFLQMGLISNDYGADYVALLSTNAEKKIKEMCGSNVLDEITCYSQKNAKRWRAIFSKREACLGKDELKTRIATKKSKMGTPNL
jgi:hypothetical protein